MLLQMTRPVQAGLRKEKHLELISNHLANSNTTGYKKDVLSFDRMMKAELTVDHRQGALKTTSSRLDLALRGPGFFKVQTPQGIRYTRDGNFTLNADSNLVTQTGDLVLGTGNEPLTIVGEDPSLHRSKISINPQGDVEIDEVVIGTVGIAGFEDVDLLEKEGNNYFVNTGAAENEIAVEETTIEQGALETANISTVTEMVGLIDVQRMYETLQKMMQTFDETDAKVIDSVGSVR